MRIEAVTPETLGEVLPLIAAYQRFYEAEPDDIRNRAYFAAAIADPAECLQYVARDAAGDAIGFATLYFPLSTVAVGRICLLNDLYTAEGYRGAGIGRALILHCLGIARERGFAEMQWRTRDTNERAQRLYDSLPATKTAWLTYRLPVEAAGEA